MTDVTDEMQRGFDDLMRFEEDLKAVFGTRSLGFSGQLKNHLCELWSRAQGQQPEWDFGDEDEEHVGISNEELQEVDDLLGKLLGEEN